ncbi:uncharacterized protein LOC34617648 [Cyclospora cayetanensis]|uniref:Uncharacterized protein LOC34617648 n=1 Tax=Cyclospora cayetanensis TaxID=88456 RepID=A0A6P6RWF5_9EIME|nr:uncharacterized protein LOC34617648 [Cyclospora cayetanensis]
MRQATDHYLSGNYEAAVSALKETIRKAPGLHDPFHLLVRCIYLSRGAQKATGNAVDTPGCSSYENAERNVSDSDSGKEAVQRDVEAKGCSGRAKETATSEKKSSSRAVAEEANGDGRDASEEATERSKDGEEDHDMRQLEENVTFQLAQVYKQMGAHERACAVLQPLHSRNWGLAPLSSLLAFCLHKSGRLQEAREVLEGALYKLLPHEATQQLMLELQRDLLHQQHQPQRQEEHDQHELDSAAAKCSKAVLSEADAPSQSATATAATPTSSNVSPEHSLLPLMEKEQQDCLNMLCEIDAEEGRHSHCLLLIQSFLGAAPLTSAPLDLAVKLAAAGVITGKLDCSAEVEARLNAAALRRRPAGGSPKAAAASAIPAAGTNGFRGVCGSFLVASVDSCCVAPTHTCAALEERENVILAALLGHLSLPSPPPSVVDARLAALGRNTQGYAAVRRLLCAVGVFSCL